MESNKASKPARRRFSNEFQEMRRKLRRRVEQLKLEEEEAFPLDAAPHAPSPTSTPRTFLFLGCLPMPKQLLTVPTFFRKLMGWENWKAAPATKPAGPAFPKAKGFGGESGNTTATDSFDAFWRRHCPGIPVDPAMKPSGAPGPKVKVFRGEIRKTKRTATENFDEFFGHSSDNEKTVDPATKPAGPAGPKATEIIDELFGHSSEVPNAEELGDETDETEVIDEVLVIIECEDYGLID